MSADHPQPSLADLLSAVATELGAERAHRIHKSATKMMWKRLIADNQRAIEAEIERLRCVTGVARRETQARMDALFTERGRMHTAAFGPMPALEARP